MSGYGPQAAESLKQTQRELERLFVLATSETVQSWNRARLTWDDEVAQSAELQMFHPLVRDAQSLHAELGELASVLMGI